MQDLKPVKRHSPHLEEGLRSWERRREGREEERSKKKEEGGFILNY
jgi:hypothetical protein